MLCWPNHSQEPGADEIFVRLQQYAVCIFKPTIEQPIFMIESCLADENESREKTNAVQEEIVVIKCQHF